MQTRSIAGAARRTGRDLALRVGTELEWLRTRRGRADLALFHEFAPPPGGGGHQFLRALTRELEGRGLEVELNRISGETSVCLFNSFNFDFRRLERFADRGARMVHRVDGPIGVYRGFDDGTDGRIARVNAELASATVFQSRFSLDKHRELGIELREKVGPVLAELLAVHRILALPAGPTVIRLLPPLVTEVQDLERAVVALGEVLR